MAMTNEERIKYMKEKHKAYTAKKDFIDSVLEDFKQACFKCALGDMSLEDLSEKQQFFSHRIAEKNDGK